MREPTAAKERERARFLVEELRRAEHHVAMWAGMHPATAEHQRQIADRHSAGLLEIIDRLALGIRTGGGDEC